MPINQAALNKLKPKVKTGHPPLWKSPEQLQILIDKYFSDREASDTPLTISGMALALDCDIDTIWNYERKDAFSGTIKKAKRRLSDHMEQRLYGNQVAGPIFWLKNAGWTDKQEQNVNVSGTMAVEVVSFAPKKLSTGIKKGAKSK